MSNSVPFSSVKHSTEDRRFTVPFRYKQSYNSFILERLNTIIIIDFLASLTDVQIIIFLKGRNQFFLGNELTKIL